MTNTTDNKTFVVRYSAPQPPTLRTLYEVELTRPANTTVEELVENVRANDLVKVDDNSGDADWDELKYQVEHGHCDVYEKDGDDLLCIAEMTD